METLKTENPSNPVAPRPCSVPDKTEAQRIIAQATVETRTRRRENGPTQLVPVLGNVVVQDTPAPRPTEEEIELRERACKAWASAGVPPRYTKADLNKVPDDVGQMLGPSKITYGDVATMLRRLIDKPAMIALLGERGTGKTWMSCGLIREFCKLGKWGMYRDAMDYFLELKSTYDRDSANSQAEVERRYLKPSLLVLDEVHERGDTAWEDRMLTRLINKRYASELSTVLIANQSVETFSDRVGTSIYDRIFDEGGIVYCDWHSLRGRTVAQ